MDIYMGIIGLLVLIIHRAVMLIAFPSRFKMRYTVGALILAYIATFWFREVSVGFISWNALTTFFNCLLMCWLLKASVFQIIFAFYFTFIATVSQWYLVDALAEIFISPASVWYSRVVFAVLLVLFTGFIALAVKYSRRLFRRLLEYGHTAAWGLYAFGAVFSFVLLTVSRDFPGSRTQYILIILFVVWSFAVFCSAIINTHDKTRHKYEAGFAASVISNASGYYQQMSELNSQIRILRHDYKYHLNTIGELLTSGGRGETEQYLADIQKQFKETEPRDFCGNEVINALLAGYAEHCDREGVKLDIEIRLPRELPVPNYELCIVIGNLLENAVEACRKQNGERHIGLTVKPLGEQLVIKAENTFYGEPVQTHETLPQSTKEDGGLGLRSVRAVAEKFGGELMLEQDGDIFTAYVTMRT